MRRDRRIPPARGFRTSDWMRIFSMILMLAVLYMLFDWARDPAVWRWFAGEQGADVGRDASSPAKQQPAKQQPAKEQPPKEQSVKQQSPKDGRVEHSPRADAGQAGSLAHEAGSLPYSGPTDEDPDERSAIEEEFQAITDKTLKIQPEEMFAYRRVVQWVLTQPASAMRQRARKDVTFNELMLSPDKYRGALVELVLNARLVRPLEVRASDGSELYEVWGFTADSGTWLHDAVVVNLPEGMPVGEVSERVRFVGYFFKLQGYHERAAKPNAPPLAAPMLIGRLIWIQAPPAAAPAWKASWGAILLVGFGALVLAQLAWMLLRPKRRRLEPQVAGAAKPSPPTIDHWLQQAEQGAAAIADASADGSPAPEKTTGGDGDGKGAGELFTGELDDGVEP